MGAFTGIFLFILMMSQHFALFPVCICWSWMGLLGHTRRTDQQHFQSNKKLYSSLFKHCFMFSEDLIVCLSSLFIFVRILPGVKKKKIKKIVKIDVILIA